MLNKKNFKKYLIVTLSVLLVAALMIVLYISTRPQAKDGVKNITIEVVLSEDNAKSYKLKTNAGFLRQAIDEEKEGFIKGTESEYGLFIEEVDGVTADPTKQQWWCITKSGETVNNGIDQIVISDGDKYEITLTTGY